MTLESTAYSPRPDNAAQPGGQPAEASRADRPADAPLHVCHLLLNLGCGGMENGLVALANGLRRDGRFRHSVVCLGEAGVFRARLAGDVPVLELDAGIGRQRVRHRRVWSALRTLKPDIVHTRNLPTIDLFPTIRAAGVRRMVHSEHGVDLIEAEGSPWRYRLVRRLGSRVIPAYVALSTGLRDWMAGQNGIPAHKISVIVNGVDTDRFRPPNPTEAQAARAAWPGALGAAAAAGGVTVIGSLGRLEAIKDHANLARAYVEMLRSRPALRTTTALVIGGEGRCRDTVADILAEAGLSDRLALPGYVAAPAGFYHGLDLFVLPSKSEGTSNTILEAMASGLPVVATEVGEARRLVAEGETGRLVPPSDPAALARALLAWLDDPAGLAAAGAAARVRAQSQFSLDRMLAAYAAVYEAAALGRTPSGV